MSWVPLFGDFYVLPQEGGTSRFTVYVPVGVRPRPHLTLFMLDFLQFFANGFQVLRYGDHGQDFKLINFL